MKVATSEEMRRIDRMAAETYGISGLILMENAGAGTARHCQDRFGPLREKTVTLVCGKGNNGGDGFVAARHLLNQAVLPRIYLLTKIDEVRGDARTNLEIFRKMGGELHEKGSFNRKNFRLALMHSHLIVDAIFGTGLTHPVEGDFAEAVNLIDAASQAGRPVLSIDMPSGIHGDTGRVLGAAVKATVTVTLALPKRGHYLYPGALHTGRLYVQEIGIPASLLALPEISVERIEAPEICRLLPARPPDAHKGNFGHALIVAGSIGKSGAAVMAAQACLRAGAGLVTLAVPKSLHPVLAAKLMEVMIYPLPETEQGTLSLQAGKVLLPLSEGKSVVAVGPGLGTERETSECIRRYISETRGPLILDADGINALADHLNLLKKRSGRVLLTPHPGEMGRILGKSSGEVQSQRIEIVRKFCQDYGSSVILKGAYTLIGGPGGEVLINPTGNAGMATAGSGDVLTGMVAGLSSQGLDLHSAATAAVYSHGMAGDMAAEEIGEVGMIAGDILERIPRVLKHLYAMGT